MCMKSQPKISIIIPVYNVESYIAECLQSVMRQTYIGEIECILVDDCGKDNSIAVAEQLINTYNGSISFRILHHDHNRGLSAARNTGTDAATGGYIYYLDSDDYISDDCIAALAQPLQEYDYDMVIGGLSRFNVENPVNFLKKETGPIMGKEEILAEFYPKNTLYDMACGKLIKRLFISVNQIGFLEGQLHEDELWTYKCCTYIRSLYVQNQVVYHYRMNVNSIMNVRMDNIPKRVQSMYDTIDYVLTHPIEIHQDLYNCIVAYYLSGFAYGTRGEAVYKNQYVSLRERIKYQPLNAWLKGKISLRILKRQFNLVLPPSLGYMYVKFLVRYRE